MTEPLLSVRGLTVEFPTRHGLLTAVEDIDLEIMPGEVLGMVGESGAGKSMTGNAIIGLIEPPGRIARGEVRLKGQRIDNLPAEEMRAIRGRRIGMIFQDPLTSLNPLYRISDQLVETIRTLHDRHGELPVRLMTANRSPEIRLLCAETGIQILTKPLDPKLLRNILAAH